MSLGKSIITVGGFTIISRITGLMREMMAAQYLGAGLLSDAFFVAFRLPNLFRSLFAEGAFNVAFIPLYSGTLTGEGDMEANKFANQAYNIMIVLLTGFVILAEIFMPQVMLVLAPGFNDVPDKMPLAIALSRICFPYLLFISLTSLQAGILNSLNRFAAAAGTPILLNIVSMAGLYFLSPYLPTNGHALAIGTSVSGVVQFIWLAYSVRHAGVHLRVGLPQWTPQIKLLLKRIVPGALGAGIYQVNILINTMIASTISNGAVSYLNYADRVNQLPLGVVGIAISTALLPLLSRQLREGAYEEANISQNRGIEFGLFLTLPATMALIVLAHPIIRVLFQHGHFTSAATDATARTLMAFALGLPAFILIKIITPSFFARGELRIPVKTALVSVIVNIGLNLILSRYLAYVGMAIATSIASWINVILLVFILHHRAYFKLDERLKKRLPRLLFSSLGMGGLLFIINYYTLDYDTLIKTALLKMIIMLPIGIVSFFILVLFTKTTNISELKGNLSKRNWRSHRN